MKKVYKKYLNFFKKVVDKYIKICYNKLQNKIKIYGGSKMSTKRQLEEKELGQIKKEMAKYSSEFVEYFINHMQSLICEAYDSDTTVEEQVSYLDSITYNTQESVNNLIKFRQDINILSEEIEEVEENLKLFFLNPEELEVLILQELFYLYVKQYDID